MRKKIRSTYHLASHPSCEKDGDELCSQCQKAVSPKRERVSVAGLVQGLHRRRPLETFRLKKKALTPLVKRYRFECDGKPIKIVKIDQFTIPSCSA